MSPLEEKAASFSPHPQVPTAKRLVQQEIQNVLSIPIPHLYTEPLLQLWQVENIGSAFALIFFS